jgi:hypothetical protein
MSRRVAVVGASQGQEQPVYPDFFKATTCAHEAPVLIHPHTRTKSPRPAGNPMEHPDFLITHGTARIADNPWRSPAA